MAVLVTARQAKAGLALLFTALLLAACGSAPTLEGLLEEGAAVPEGGSPSGEAPDSGPGEEADAVSAEAPETVLWEPASDARLAIKDVAASVQEVPLYERLEVSFSIEGSVATDLDFPYDPQTPPGLEARTGISVEGLFLPPGASSWEEALVQPAFRYQAYERIIKGEAEGLYPIGDPVWMIRFAPTVQGTWRFKIRAQDASTCPARLDPCLFGVETDPLEFTAGEAPAGSHGFIRVSQADPRYFEYSDGTPFVGLGHQTSFGSNTQVEERFDRYRDNGVNLLRSWMSATGVYSLGFYFWDTWANSWLVFEGTYPGSDVASRIVGEGDSPCIFHGFGEGALAALKGGQTYQIQIRARLEDVERPQTPGRPYGLVVKYGTWPKDICGQAGNGLTTLSDYWNGTGDWTVYTSEFTLPEDVVIGWDGYLTIALENTDGGKAFIDEIRVAESEDGPNVLVRGDMNYHLYYDQASSWRWDRILDEAAGRGIHLKLVVLEKQDGILGRLRPDGSIADEPADANFHGAHPTGLNRPTKARRLQEYFWRYLGARWGYSTAVHSWELLNEGDPFSPDHYDQANAMGRVIRASDPNRHLVTTSFWHSFPVEAFWSNPAYPYVDYADFHAYVDTSWLDAETDIADAIIDELCRSDQDCYLNAMKDDSALFHLEHSQNTSQKRPGKPVIRGESALTLPDTMQETDPDLMRDVNGVWLHKFLFAQVDAGGLYELYWYNDEIIANGLHPVFKRFSDFMAGIPINSGGFEDAAPFVQGAGLRVTGQKDTVSGLAYLWIDNRNHTWKRVVRGEAIRPVAGRVEIGGFTPGAVLPIEWWNTCSGEPPGSCTAGVETVGEVRADGRGVITLEIEALQTDRAVKIGVFPAAAPEDS